LGRSSTAAAWSSWTRDLPKLPYHNEGQALPLDEAAELVERVRVSEEKHATMPPIASDVL
jgi:hypothetical protein